MLLYVLLSTYWPRLNQPQNSGARAPLLISHTYNKTDYVQSWIFTALPRPFISYSHSNTLWCFAYFDIRGHAAYMNWHPSLVAVASLPATVERDVEIGNIRCKLFTDSDMITCFFIIKPTGCTIFTNLFWHETLHVSDSSSVHHQEFIHCTLSNGVCYTGL
jgi:hypothetical protein